MKLAFIAPTAHLVDVSSLGSIQFFLAHLFDDHRYQLYYDKCKSVSAYTIIDNGVVETNSPMASEDLIELAQRLQPDELVGPDFRDEADKTLVALEEFIPEFRSQCPGIKLMGVVHGKSFSEWLDSYKTLGQMDIDVIGIPYRLAFDPEHYSNAVSWAMNRNKVLQFIGKNIIEGVEYHCLGLNTLDELIYFFSVGWIRSCDSSFVYRQTLLLGLFRPGMRMHKRSLDGIDFAEVSEHVIDVVRRNIFYLKYLVGDTDPIPLGGCDIER